MENAISWSLVEDVRCLLSRGVRLRLIIWADERCAEMLVDWCSQVPLSLFRIY